MCWSCMEQSSSQSVLPKETKPMGDLVVFDKIGVYSTLFVIG